MTTHVTDAEMDRLVEKVTRPDNVFDLRDVEREVAAAYGVSTAEAKRFVRNWDRRQRRRSGDLDLWRRLRPR